MKKIDYKSMRIYKLFRSTELDHEFGRPVIFLDFLGNESLVWTGTSKQSQIKEIPFIMVINGKNTYFYNKGLIKVNTKDLINKYKDAKTKKIITLSDEQQKSFISKLAKFTFQSDPYLEIARLKFENNQLKIENELLKNEIKNNEDEKLNKQDIYEI